MKKRNWIILVCVILYSLFIGYKYQIRNRASAAGATNELKVVTSFYPMYMHTKVIMEGTPHELINMASQTVGCLHDYQLTVQDAKKLYDADVLIINGLGSETFIEKAYKQNKNLKVVDASSEIAKIIEEDEAHIQEVHNHDEHDHEDDHNHDDHDHNHDDHDHDHINDHIWLSIKGSIMQIEQIANELIKIDPTYEDVYKENAKAYIAALEELDKVAQQSLLDYENKKVVSVHDAFEYLAEDLDIEIIETIPEGSYENASAKQLETLIDGMKESDAKVILTEARNKDLAILQMIQKETDAKIYILDTFVAEAENLDLVEGQAYEYVARMKKNIETLSEAFDYE